MKHILYLLWAVLATASAFGQADMDSSGPDGLPAWVTEVGARSEPTATTEFAVTDYGAVNDGTTLCTANIQAAIDAANTAGGGIVTFEPGTYLTGSLFIKSDVHFRIDEDVILLGSQNEADYPFIPTRVAGIEMDWPAALVNVNTATNVLVSGGGTIDAHGEFWWDKFRNMRANNLDPYGVLVDGHSYADDGDLRWALDYDCSRARLMVVWESENVTIRNLNMNRSGFWTVQIVYSKYVTADELIVRNSSSSSFSTDGVNIDSSSWVLVQHCDIVNNDDCFCLKAGRDWDGLRVNRPTTNVVIRYNITGASGGGSIAFGSETSGSISNIVAYGNHADGTAMGIRFKSATTRGGTVENVLIQNMTMGTVRIAFDFDQNWLPSYSYASIPSGMTDYPAHWDILAAPVSPAELGIPTCRNITIRDIDTTSAYSKIFSAVGLSSSYISNVLFQCITAEGSSLGSLSYCSDWNMEDVVFNGTTETPTLYNCSNINVSPPQDSDGDGSLDSWESAFGGDPNDGAVIPPIVGSNVSVIAFTSIQESGIAPSNTYTHAISGGATRTVNGVAFDALTTAATPANFTWIVTGGTKGAITSNNLNTWSPVNGGLDTTDQELIDLLGTLTYVNGATAGDSQSFVLSGLTPGQWYDLRLYIRAWDPTSIRSADLRFINGTELIHPYNGLPEDSPDLVLNNGNADSAYYLSCRYQARDTELTIQTTSHLANGQSFHLYALTNQKIYNGKEPPAPAGISATAVSMSQIDLSWPPVADTTGYALKRSSSPDGLFTTVVSEIQGTTYSDTGLDQSTTYSYVVCAINAGGEGTPSPASTATTLAGASDLTISNLAVSSGEPYEWFDLAAGELTYIDRTYTYNAPIPAGLTGQKTLRTANDDKSNTGLSLSFDISHPATVYVAYDTRLALPTWMAGFTDTGEALTLAGDVAVHELWARNYSAGTVTLGGNAAGTSKSMYMVVVTQPLPDIPDNVTAIAASLNQADLSWNAASNAVYYSVKRATASGGPYATIAGGLTEPGFSDTGLTPGTTYYYVVSALNAGGESAVSQEAFATTQPSPAITLSMDNGLPSMSWPSNCIGWMLQCRTNLTTGNWTALPETAATNRFDIPYNTDSAFYRLVP